MHHAVLSLLLLAGLPLQAPSATPQAGAPLVQADERAKELNRVLYFVGGGCVRARTRWVEDHWEYRDGGPWATLPKGAVERAALERELLAQSRELARAVGKDDDEGRVRLAEWMLRSGLLEEGLSEVERVLDRAPDHKAALALVRTPPMPFRVPGAGAEELDEALRIAAGTPRALQEAAIAALEQRERPATLDALKKALGSHSPRIRAFGALALRRIDPQADVRALLGRAVLDGSDAVRLEAALALRDVKDAAVLVPVVKALGSQSPAVRENAVEALGNMGYPAALEPLAARLAALSAPQGGGGWNPPRANIFVGRQLAYVQDFDVEVAQFASVADPQINVALEGSVLDVRVVGVYETTTAVESRKVRLALGRLSGASPGNSNRSWLDWWEQHKREYGVATPARPATPTTN